MRRERLLTLLLVGLLFVAVPSVSAEQDTITIEAQIDNLPEKGWFASGEVVQVSANLVNIGEMTSITIDPTCNEILRIWSGSTIISDYSDNCIGQSRGMDVDGYSTTPLSVLSWDLTDNEGNIVPSGEYTVEYLIPGEDISSEITVMVQTPIAIPEAISMEVVITARDGAHVESAPSILTVTLQNNLQKKVNFDSGDCKLIINTDLVGDCGPDNFESHQVVTIAQMAIIPNEGINQYSISLGDGGLSKEVTFTALADNDDGISYGQSSALKLQLSTSYDQNSGFESFESDIIVENTNEENVTLEFDDVCRAEMWAVDYNGVVVMDTRSFKDCSQMNTETIISPGSTKIYTQPEWQFIDKDACYVPPGDLTLVMEIPEHDLYATEIIPISRDRDFYCQEDRANIEITTSGSEILTIEPSITATEPVDIKWFKVCGLESKLYGPNGFIAEYLSQCDYTDTTTIRIEQHVLETFEIDMNSMEDGEYSLVFETNTAPQVRSTISFEWPLNQENSNVVDEEITETENIQSILVQGYWSATSGEYGKCWLLNTQDDQIITLSGSPGLLNWMPETGVNGQYSAYESEPSPACDLFAAPSITITEVISEDNPELEISPEPENVVDTMDVKSEDELDPMIINAGIVVASGGILSLLFALITTNETLRIPATTIGLWFLGLIGRTSETSDGRYQRGRLMGYLTANPGCHFRALMAALDMSNGQITHHLKILQDEDRIWRRPDGRLVRFYPYTTDLHPEISDDDLPLPPLSPDPNSLQGKILRLLDDDGQMNKSPTQAELAQRLERSQQLVSHHLRTLQKFGLVERLKKGMKNRYCLTKEAVFLLDTTEL